MWRSDVINDELKQNKPEGQEHNNPASTHIILEVHSVSMSADTLFSGKEQKEDKHNGKIN